ncbi:MAG: crossover junction endodeoxyribonuclease RuvC [Candidatus Omnitrophica bacterium]|nr:crossover junction endodeoxyribonuclease RuvC [Candidatus Omnitrophota bacterium]
MIILGIDPALTITGYGAIDFKKNKISVIEAGIIATSVKQALPERLNKIYLGITKLVSDVRPEVIVLEKLYAHYRHPVTAYILGQARGIVCLVSAQEKIRLVEYAATRVKKAIVGAGLAPKHQVQKMVASILDLKSIPKYADVTDALALAIAYIYMRPRI